MNLDREFPPRYFCGVGSIDPVESFFAAALLIFFPFMMSRGLLPIPSAQTYVSKCPRLSVFFCFSAFFLLFFYFLFFFFLFSEFLPSLLPPLTLARCLLPSTSYPSPPFDIAPSLSGRLRCRPSVRVYGRLSDAPVEERCSRSHPR